MGSTPTPGTMKIIFLNIWGGKIFEPLMKFIKKSGSNTDFFCFQEVLHSPTPTTTYWGGRTDIRNKLIQALPQFIEYYAPSHNILDTNNHPTHNTEVGLTIFVKKGIDIHTTGIIHVQGNASDIPYTNKKEAPHYLQHLSFQYNNTPYTIGNFQGTAYPGSKLDTPERLKQSKKIADFFKKQKGEKILGGDFNLLPQTKSISIIEEMGMRNLITEFGIQSTRSDLSYALYPEAERQYFADYIFVSNGINVQNFEVPRLNISDHLPLILKLK